MAEIDISTAWSALARLGFPGRFTGRTQDGSYEFAVINPTTGSLMTTGTGRTLETAMFDAASRAGALNSH